MTTLLVIIGNCMPLKHWKDSSQVASMCKTFDKLRITEQSAAVSLLRHAWHPTAVLANTIGTVHVHAHVFIVQRDIH